MEFGVHDTVYNRHYFPATEGAVHQAFYQTKINPPGEEPKFYNLTYGITRMREVQ